MSKATKDVRGSEPSHVDVSKEHEPSYFEKRASARGTLLRDKGVVSQDD